LSILKEISMQAKKYIRLLGLLFLFIAPTLTSCKKYLEVDPARQLITADNAFSDDKTADATTTGMYTKLLGTFSNAMRMSSMTADNIVDIYNSVSNQPMVNNALKADDVNVLSAWQTFYLVIYQANDILERGAASPGISPARKQQLMGEAKFTRAFIHFMLVNFWGSIPYVKTTDVNVTALITRTPVDEIYSDLIDDLKSAQSLLPVAYPTSGRARPDQAVATALLAEVYLYQGDWKNAETEASKLLSDPNYILNKVLAGVFLRTSTETIWQLNTVNGFTADGAAYVPASGAPLYKFTDGLIAQIEPNDSRLANWVRTVTVTGVTYNSPFKYKVRALVTTPPVPPAEDLVVFRLAEQFLIRAEARAQQDNLTGAVADLDSVRVRAGLPGIAPSITKANLLLAVEHERRIELMGEMYHRWFDLKRTKRVDAVLGPLKPTWVPTAALYPIPSNELVKNPNMKQNPGY
jgi:hypothetical protein